MTIFTILLLPIHEHGSSSLLLIPSLISFFSVLKILSCKSFTCLVIITPSYVILRKAIKKHVIPLMSFSVDLSFVYRRATKFLWVHFVSSYFAENVYRWKSSLVKFFGSLAYYSIMSSRKVKIFLLLPLQHKLPLLREE